MTEMLHLNKPELRLLNEIINMKEQRLQDISKCYESILMHCMEQWYDKMAECSRNDVLKQTDC